MGIVVTLEVDGVAQTIADPSGGRCDAAGDFDRLLPFPDDLPMLSRLDPYGEATFTSAELTALADEVQTVIDRESDGRERRGLHRLHALASRGSVLPGSVLRLETEEGHPQRAPRGMVGCIEACGIIAS
jgi:hypothetical protein